MKQMLKSASGKDNSSVVVLRLRIKAAEIEAEKIEQEWLNDWISNRLPQRTILDADAAVRTNIRLLLNTCDAGNVAVPERLIAAVLAQRAGLN